MRIPSTRRLAGAIRALIPWALPAILLAAGAYAPPRAVGATVSVLDFGATGDGVTNDSDAIEAALESGAAPRTVRFPAGDYVFSNLYIPAHTAVVFESGARALAPASASSQDFFFAVLGSSASPLRNASLAGGTFLGGSRLDGVVLATFAEDLTIRDVDAYDVRRFVAADRSRRVAVRDVSVRNGRSGFAFEECEHVDVSDCSVRDVERDGIVFYGRSRYVTASRNHVEDYMTSFPDGIGGIHLYGSTDATFTDNVILDGHGNSAGIRIRDGERFHVEGNYVAAPGSSGFQVHRVGDFPGLDGGDGTFIRNTVVGARLRGFDVANPLSKSVRIVGNLVYDTSSSSPVSAGMGIVAVPGGSIVIGNAVEGATGAGIHVGEGGQHVVWNTVRNAASVNFGASAGVFVQGTDTAVVANEIADELDNMAYGVLLYDGASALIRDNLVQGATIRPYEIRGQRLSVLRGDATTPKVARRVLSTTTTATVLAFDASDAGSGVLAMRVSLDGKPRYVLGSNATVVLPTAGVHWAEVIAVDRAGNIGGDTVYAGIEAQSVAGPNRYGTSVAASKAGFPAGAASVVVATGSNWPDALGGAALAAARGGPILLTPPDRLPGEVAAEIRRLGATSVVVLGSENAVGRAVFAALQKQVGAAGTSRIGGRDRYATAELVARATRTALGDGYDGHCFVATGADFPDALAASPVAAARGWPILLASPRGLSPSTASTMRALGVGAAHILGGTSVVPSSVESSLRSFCTVSRLAGRDRYATAKTIAEWGVASAGLGWDNVAIATGNDFPDALSGGVLQGTSSSVMLLTPSTRLDGLAASALRRNKADIGTVRFLGGTAALGPTVRNQVLAALQ